MSIGMKYVILPCPVVVMLRKSVVHKSAPQREAPYFLFGRAATAGDVLPSPEALPNGAYRLSATTTGAAPWGGPPHFTQDRPCPGGKKGKKKGCMK
jgi:hypothetical protein